MVFLGSGMADVRPGSSRREMARSVSASLHNSPKEQMPGRRPVDSISDMDAQFDRRGPEARNGCNSRASTRSKMGRSLGVELKHSSERFVLVL